MTKAPDHIQHNFGKALLHQPFDWGICVTRYFVGNSRVHLINNMVGRDIYIESRGQEDNSIKWVVYMQGWVLGKDLQYHYEQNPSSRTTQFIKNTRYLSKELALDKLIDYENKNAGKPPEEIPLFV